MLTATDIRELQAQVQRPQSFLLFVSKLRGLRGPGWALECLHGQAADQRLDKGTVRACETAICRHFNVTDLSPYR